jgi:hypothetical protein
VVDPFTPIHGKSNGQARAPGVQEWLVVMPVPPDAPKPPEAHPKLGKPSSADPYSAPAGALLGFVYRFDTPRGKEFRPLVLYRSVTSGALVWRWESWPAPRPLYGLDRLAARPKARAIVVEGEKAANAAQRLLPDSVCITSPNGSKSAGKADWSPLRGREVIIWPDADEPGQAYAKAVAKLAYEAAAASVALLAPPAGALQGWDAADAEAEGWTQTRTAEFIAGAKAAEQEDATGKARPRKEKRRPQRDSLMGLCDKITLWHGADGEAFATVPINSHSENWPIRSQSFKRWLSARAYEELGLAPGGQAIEDTLRVLEARAVSEGREQEPWRRVGYRAGKIYIDLADPDWRAIEVRPNGWDLVSGDGLPFLRSPRMRPLCEPEAGWSIDELQPFVNIASDDDFALVVAWLVAALRDRGPYVILTIQSEQGSGKSSFSKLLRSLVDPSSPAVQGPPRDERDLVVNAQNAHLLALDNLSHVPSELSDALCRMATGSGFATRMLHTDKDENIFDGARPIILNGIPALAERPDLAERSIVVHLASIPEEQRRPEDELAEEWEIARPRVLGAILDGLSSALRRVKETRLVRAGRMADFEKWVTAAEAGLGWQPGTFSSAYEANRRNSADATFEADPVAMAIEGLIREDYPRGWTGTATRLLEVLNPKVSETLKKTKVWPATAQGLGNRIERVKPLLRQRGIILDRKHSGERLITITLRDTAASGNAAPEGAE